ncbi:hypothetical protein BU26DRAFT_512609 [Trematosphaeria pertusa]|uniref:F1F0 ATP synthase assembly protein Atp10 n=1 Tax=Trematosphaeria pertusa TaxID=390896 RepID=A0A6A6J2G0_9PLEO|nr:uncharacterized protein BU26DRAFT_512609 [Trematosphaeria pertusa]KAF2255643.1 hypothetical protein BU26DRAFT_512609 [Trematosphaeria pertusa]
MLQPRIASPLGRTLLNASSICLRSHHRALNAHHLPVQSFTSAAVLRQPTPSSKQAQQQPEPSKDEETFVPKPLGRPIGFSHPPHPGDNTLPALKPNYSGMTLSQRNLAKRADIVEKWGTNYFRDFKNIRKYRSGKTFVANPRLFKKEAALYFPNLRGETLQEKGVDTTQVLSGKVSVVNLFSSAWGEAQVHTFTGKRANPELHELLQQNRNVAQQVDINVEENSMKAWIIALFQWRLRRQRRKDDWGKYFVIRSGVSQKIRETIGCLNGRVGYVYLLDQDCKIRWAGSADAEGTEVQDLTRGLKRLIEEARAGATKTRSKIPVKTGEVGAGAEKDEKGLPIPVPIAFK